MIERKSEYSREELLQCGEGKLFEPGHAKLPVPNMLMFDRISSISKDGGKYGKGQLVAEFEIDPDMWFFKCHFIGDPVMPGCLGLDALWQLVGFYITWSGFTGKGRALGVGEVKFFGQVLPENKLIQYKIDIKRLLTSKLKLAIADGSLLVDSKEIYTATNLRVGLFTDEAAF